MIQDSNNGISICVHFGNCFNSAPKLMFYLTFPQAYHQQVGQRFSAAG
jgi:hypothetical protein